jgi:hypothetical protein
MVYDRETRKSKSKNVSSSLANLNSSQRKNSQNEKKRFPTGGTLEAPFASSTVENSEREKVEQTGQPILLASSSGGQGVKAVSGTKAVTPEVAIQILENLSRGEPPFRPDLSLGGVEWMTTEGNPYTATGANKNVTLSVEAIRPAKTIIFQETDLVSIRDQILSQIPDAQVEASYRQKQGIPQNQPLNRKQRSAISKLKKKTAEQRMWVEVGKRVKNSQVGVGEVILQNSEFSKQGNGKFLLVADRTKVKVKGGMNAVIKALERSGATAQPVIKEAAEKLVQQRNLGKVQAVFKYGGRILIVVAVAAEAYKIYHAQNKVKAVVESAGGWVGAGAAVAAFNAYWAPANATGPWAWVVTGVGTLVAGGVGYWVGSGTTRTIYELVLEE